MFLDISQWLLTKNWVQKIVRDSELPSEAVWLCNKSPAYILGKHAIGTRGAHKRKYFLKTASESIWYILSYMCETRRCTHIENPFCMFEVKRSYGNFYGLRFLIFIAFFNIFWSSEVCSGMPLRVHTWISLKNKQTPVKQCISNSFLCGEKTVFQR